MSIGKAQFLGRRHQVKSVRRLTNGHERPGHFFTTTLPDYYSLPSGTPALILFLCCDSGKMIWRGSF